MKAKRLKASEVYLRAAKRVFMDETGTCIAIDNISRPNADFEYCGNNKLVRKYGDLFSPEMPKWKVHSAWLVAAHFSDAGLYPAISKARHEWRVMALLMMSAIAKYEERSRGEKMRLTDKQRAWLSAPGRSAMLTHQVTLDFIKVFGLSAEDAGDLLAQWASECYERM